MELLKTLAHGALGSLTMGIWWYVITNKQMEKDKKKLEQILTRN